MASPSKRKGKAEDAEPGEFVGLPKPLGGKGGQGILTKQKVTQQQVDDVMKGNKKAEGGPEATGDSRPVTMASGDDLTEINDDDDEPSTRDPSRLQTAASLSKANSIPEEEGEGDGVSKEETKAQKRARQRVAHIRKQFEKVDVKGKGLIETHRLHEGFGILGLKFEKYEVNKMIQKFDEDNSGTIDFDEFKDMITELNRRRYHKVFSDFDVDGSGELDVDEVKAAFALLDFQFTDEQMAEMMAEFDDSGDGLIQFPEFAEMLDSTLIGEEEKQEIDVVDETPWANTHGVQTPIEPLWLEEEKAWGWVVVSEKEMLVDENPDDRVIGVGIPTQRATCYVRTDGLPFRGLKGGVYMPLGWRSKNKPVRTIHWGMPETSSWEGPGGALVGTGEVERVRVRFTGPTLNGPMGRVLMVPDASMTLQPMGDTPTQLDPDEDKDTRPWKGWDKPVFAAESPESLERAGTAGGLARLGSQGSLGRSESAGTVSKLVSFGDGVLPGARQVGEGEVLTIESRPGSRMHDPMQPDEQQEFSPLQSRAGTPDPSRSSPERSDEGTAEGEGKGKDGGGAATAGSAGSGGAPITKTGSGRGTITKTGSRGESSKAGASRDSKGSKPPTGKKAQGTAKSGGGASEASRPESAKGDKPKSAGQNKDDKKDFKLEKMKARLEDLRLKQAQDGLALMEGREMALLVRHIRKAEEEAAAKKQEEERVIMEELSWQPTGLVHWRFKVVEMSDTGLGMRIGVVHSSVEPGKDWNDYTSCNNKTFWWNSFSGNIFVGDVKVSESGSIYSLDICKGMWAPSRNNPQMGVPFMQGDVVSIRLDLEAGELTFKRNEELLPHRVCGVWGEVFPAVQMSAAGDKVMLLETVEEKDARVNGRLMFERMKAEEERRKRDIARRAALQALGLV